MTKLYQSPKNGELTLGFTITDGQTRLYSSIYRVFIPDLQVGQVVLAHAQFQIANNVYRYADPNGPGPYPDLVGLAHFLISHPQDQVWLDSLTFPFQGTVINPAWLAGENVTRDNHYGFRTLVGSFVAKQSGGLWISVVVYAATSAVGFPGQKMDVKQGYGGLNAIVF